MNKFVLLGLSVFGFVVGSYFFVKQWGVFEWFFWLVALVLFLAVVYFFWLARLEGDGL